jgi:hypothetical protein
MEVSLKIHETGRKRLGGCQAYSEFKKPNIFIFNCSATNWYNEFVSSEAAMSKPLTIFFWYLHLLRLVDILCFVCVAFQTLFEHFYNS